MRVPATVETSRRDVSHHAVHRKGMAHSPHKIAYQAGRANQNGNASKRDRAAIETPHRGVSTLDSAYTSGCVITVGGGAEGMPR
jgi:hypothetical protein